MVPGWLYLPLLTEEGPNLEQINYATLTDSNANRERIIFLLTRPKVHMKNSMGLLYETGFPTELFLNYLD